MCSLKFPYTPELSNIIYETTLLELSSLLLSIQDLCDLKGLLIKSMI